MPSGSLGFSTLGSRLMMGGAGTGLPPMAMGRSTGSFFGSAFDLRLDSDRIQTGLLRVKNKGKPTPSDR
jgi:hypothetical protein